MNLYLISQPRRNVTFDTYDSAVVCALNEEIARNMNPDSGELYTPEEWKKPYGAWCDSPEQVTVKYLGKASEELTQGVVCASFNAG